MSKDEIRRLMSEGETLLKEKDDAEALAVFERAVDLAPNNAAAWYGKGLA